MTAPPTLADLQAQLECVKREVARRALEAWRGAERMTLADLQTMQAVEATLRWLIEARQLSLFSDSASRAQ